MENKSTQLEWMTYDFASSNAFRNLYENKTLTDVTIACEGNQKIEAHKVVLSACSDFFMKILEENPNPNPLIYLQGITIEDLMVLKKFMYLGKADIEQHLFDSFLKVSKTLLNHTELSKDILQDPDMIDTSLCAKEENKNQLLLGYPITEWKERHKKKKQDLNCNKCDYICSSFSTLFRHIGNNHGELCCISCEIVIKGKFALSDHIRVNHKIYKCSECSFSTRFSSGIFRHKGEHNVEMKQCDQCEYSTRILGSLRMHMESKHEEAVYMCDTCDFQTNTGKKLKFHNQKVHMGIRYNCDSCDYRATKNQNLKAHKLIHAKVRYDCKYCKFGDIQMSRVKLHEKRQHPTEVERETEVMKIWKN